MPSTDAKAVMIVDDSASVRQALCKIFEREEGIQVCAEAQNGRDAIEKDRALRPDLIVETSLHL